ncbi:hypothetical protein PHO31112_03381 [Pandoraea horticolens]|uniref:Uncharacterized protein n=1 Tax=Pandoraea horticolens TaxID=2508298 RepID=A0A5E4WP92_9BURK|nr:hypothetical protein PHO31112_03381 [Pandoraea horticolens]
MPLRVYPFLRKEPKFTDQVDKFRLHMLFVMLAIWLSYKVCSVGTAQAAAAIDVEYLTGDEAG